MTTYGIGLNMNDKWLNETVSCFTAADIAWSGYLELRKRADVEHIFDLVYDELAGYE